MQQSEGDLPAIFHHCEDIYAAMQQEAVQTTLKVEGKDVAGLVYEGFLTKLFAKLDFSVPYYTTVMRELRRMDCVRQIRRGGNTAPSQWLLLQEPTPDLFRNAPAVRTKRPVTKAERLEQQVRDLNNRVASLESKVV